MSNSNYNTIPRHIGVIPDGNRRWAQARGLPKHEGYVHGLPVALQLLDDCHELGVRELTFYGFTQDNTKRPAVQRRAFQKACVQAVRLLEAREIHPCLVGNRESTTFPDELRAYDGSPRTLNGSIQVNLLINYSWQWDLDQALHSRNGKHLSVNDRHLAGLGSAAVSRIDLVLRWGGRCRLSGFLPIQTVYSDFFVIDDFWPDYNKEHLHQALSWYQTQDVTLGG